MHKSIFRTNSLLLRLSTVFMLAYLLASCTNTKKLVVLSDISDTSIVQLPTAAIPVTTIQPDDILEIKITGKNEATVKDFNEKGGGYVVAQASGVSYLVDKEGFIEIFKLGKIKAAGLTKEELKAKLLPLLDKELVDANVVIRFSNFKFTVLGEIKVPTNFFVPNEKVTLLDAIGYAGDFTINANRSKVRVIRDSAGFRTVGTVNFTQKSLFSSPYFYLRRNDVLFVESDDRAKKSSDVLTKTSTYVGILTSLLTLTLVFINRN